MIPPISKDFQSTYTFRGFSQTVFTKVADR